MNLIGVIVVGFLVLSWADDLWHSKWRYATRYGVSEDKVYIDSHPHGCAFFAAPLGLKYCHYDRTSSTLRWATSTTGNPIASYDDGKTWDVLTPDAAATVPRTSTVEEVYVRWEKKDE